MIKENNIATTILPDKPQPLGESECMQIFSTLPIYTYEFNIEDHYTRIFSTAIDPLKIASSVHKNSYHWWAERVYPEDLDSQNDAFEQWLKEGCHEVLMRKYRFRGEISEYHWIEDRTKLLSEISIPTRFVGSFTLIDSLETLKKRLHVVTNNVPAVIFELELKHDGSTRFPYASEGLRHIYNVDPGEVKVNARKVFESIHPDDVQMVKESLHRSAKNMSEWHCNYRVLRNHEVIWVSAKAIPTKSINSIIWHGITTDITNERILSEELETNQRLLLKAQEIAGIGNWRLESKGHFIHCSPRLLEILGINQDAAGISLQTFTSMISQDKRLIWEEALQNSTSDASSIDLNISVDWPENHVRWLHITGDFVTDTNFKGWIGLVKDITSQVSKEQILYDAAARDELTGIFNRRHLMRVLENLYDDVRTNAAQHCIIMFDVDDFKLINDNYGHKLGDDVLKKVVTEISSLLRKQDTIARFGGEEFVIILRDTDVSNAKQIAEDLRLIILNTQIFHENNAIHVSATFGVSQLQPTDKTYIEVITRADLAMYKGKELGKNIVQISTENF